MKKKRDESIAARTRNAAVPGRAGINASVVFQALLRHERCRSDRDGSQFSLAVFDIAGLNSNGRGVRRVANRIREKMRSIDEVGWIDTRRIGVLLPATGIEGGRKFAQRVCDSIPWEVYVYPEQWTPGGKDNNRQDTAASPKGGDVLAKVFYRPTPGWKTCMDIAGSLLLILSLSPLFLALAAYVKLVSPGKVFYLQKRVGQRGRLFTFIKFRTMHQDNDPSAHREYLKELIRNKQPMEKLDADRDTRIIPGGRIIRKMCLDELPQLFNVLRGEMSLVGPRPCIPYEAEEYLRWHAHRFDSLPGMTGLWQVSGKNKLSFEQMIRLDISYCEHLSPLRDLKILLLTGPAIVRMVLEAVGRKAGIRALRPTAVTMIEGGEKGTFHDA